MAQPRFFDVTTFAYREILRQGISTLPINATSFYDSQNREIIVVSFQKYASLSGLSLNLLTVGGCFGEGLAMRRLRPDLNLLLYNEQSYNMRQRHTILHETGHFICNHNKHGEIEEVEAHFFASQFLTPNVLIREIKHRGYRISKKFLMNTFKISGEAADKKLNYLTRYPETHKNDYDAAILDSFNNYLNLNFPPADISILFDESLFEDDL
jgi:Zn-dependent peptidase ImmA (M78 family)